MRPEPERIRRAATVRLKPDATSSHASNRTVAGVTLAGSIGAGAAISTCALTDTATLPSMGVTTAVVTAPSSVMSSAVRLKPDSTPDPTPPTMVTLPWPRSAVPVTRAVTVAGPATVATVYSPVVALTAMKGDVSVTTTVRAPAPSASRVKPATTPTGTVAT